MPCTTLCICALCGSSTKCLESVAMSVCERKSGEPHTMRMRIQEAHNVKSDSTVTDVNIGMPPGLAHLPPGGRHPERESEYANKVKRMPLVNERTAWAMLFDMVAELAMWQADLSIWFA
eukprot:2773807-Amphidinium_carterae.1